MISMIHIALEIGKYFVSVVSEDGTISNAHNIPTLEAAMDKALDFVRLQLSADKPIDGEAK